jgi:putative ABC transport system permease protein
MFHRLAAQVKAMLRRRRAERELDDELGFHMDMETRANIERGMSETEARRTALGDLGGIDQTRERVHDVHALFFDGVVGDIRYALRRMKRNARSAALVGVTIGLAVGLATTVYSIATAVLLRPLPYENPDRLVTVFRTLGDVNIIPLPAPEFFDLRERARSISGLAGIERDGYSLITPKGARWADAFSATTNLFSVLGVRALTGRTFQPGEDQPGREKVVVLSESLWREAFESDPGIIGRRVRLTGRGRRPGESDAYEVIGIVPSTVRLFYRLPLRADIYVPRVASPTDLSEDARMSPAFLTFGRLARGAAVKRADEEVRDVLAATAREHPKASIPSAGSRVTSLHEELVGQTRPAFVLLTGAAFVLLVIGCVNVAGLLLAGAVQRSQELAVRLAIGCSRRRLWRQLLTEHVLLAAVGGGLGILIALWTIPMLRRMAPESLPRMEQIRVEPTGLLFAAAVSLLTGLAFGAFPAWAMVRTHLAVALKASATTLVPRTRRVRAAFVIVTTALALPLLTSAGLIANGLWRLAHVELGFDPAVAVFNMELPDRWSGNARSSAFERALLARVRAVPGVGAASSSSEVPFAWGALDPNVGLVDGRRAAPSEVTACDADYLRVLKVPLRAGRLLEGRDDGNPGVALINERFGQALAGRAVGQRIRVAGKWREVVGVVGNITEIGQIKGRVIRQAGFTRLTTPAVYIPSGTYHEGWTFRHLLVRTTLSLETITNAVAAQLRVIDPDATIRRAVRLDARVNDVGADATFFAAIIAAFALVALALSSVGLYGVLAHSVSQRSTEIAIRAALGAEPRKLRAGVVGEALAMFTCGALVGLVLSAWAARATGTLLFEVSPGDPATAAVVLILLGVVAAAASYGPSRRAAHVDLVSALKAE